MNIKLRPEDRIKILNGNDTFKVMRRVLSREEKLDHEKEHFWIGGLNSHNLLLFVELISLGSVNGTLVHPMNVFRVGVLKKRSGL